MCLSRALIYCLETCISKKYLLNLLQSITLGPLGDEKSPSDSVIGDCACSMPAYTNLYQVIFESTSPCLIRPPPFSSPVLRHRYCCTGGSFSLQSEDCAIHFPSPCSHDVLEPLHACPPHRIFICRMIKRYRQHSAMYLQIVKKANMTANLQMCDIACNR